MPENKDNKEIIRLLKSIDETAKTNLFFFIILTFALLAVTAQLEPNDYLFLYVAIIFGAVLAFKVLLDTKKG